ncbi:MAG: hypothetical protein C0627_01930 [Sulfurimonas sp.]|nr:MAG: hypothetical protein C0627_01930 [Sulfurimonas sp.]
MTVNSNNSVYSSYGSSSVNASLQRGKPNFEEMANELLASMDSDSNGSIDKAEFSAAAQSMASQSDNTSELDEIFSSLDTDSDGSMSSEELMSALKNMKPAEGAERMAQGAMPPPPPQDEATSSEDSTSSEVFAALDTNEDGSISAEEFQALFADDSSQETENSSQTNEDKLAQMKKDIFEKILSYYGNSVSTTDTTSLLSISA